MWIGCSFENLPDCAALQFVYPTNISLGIATDILKSYQATYDQDEQDKTVKQLRQELSVKEEGLGRLSEQYAQLQEECTTIQNELKKEKAKQKQYETASEELVGIVTHLLLNWQIIQQ